MVTSLLSLLLLHLPSYCLDLTAGSTKYLDQNLRPLLEKYRVATYWCGHDHGSRRPLVLDAHPLRTPAQHVQQCQLLSRR